MREERARDNYMGSAIFSTFLSTLFLPRGLKILFSFSGQRQGYGACEAGLCRGEKLLPMMVFLFFLFLFKILSFFFFWLSDYHCRRYGYVSYFRFYVLSYFLSYLWSFRVTTPDISNIHHHHNTCEALSCVLGGFGGFVVWSFLNCQATVLGLEYAHRSHPMMQIKLGNFFILVFAWLSPSPCIHEFRMISSAIDPTPSFSTCCQGQPGHVKLTGSNSLELSAPNFPLHSTDNFAHIVRRPKWGKSSKTESC